MLGTTSGSRGIGMSPVLTAFLRVVHDFIQFTLSARIRCVTWNSVREKSSSDRSLAEKD